MLTLVSKLRREDSLKATASDSTRQVSVTDRLFVKEVAEPEANLPYRCKVHFSNPRELHCFQEQLPTPIFWPGEFHGLYSA
uniref:Uncharacterized protein n=1 Tax=Capra hircus TaxID=9925 RepID=A0A452ETP8_CAPHI